MKNLLFVAGLLTFVSSLSWGFPEPVITVTDSYNGYATVGGKLNDSTGGQAVGISVQNGNILYSTVTDSEGRWAVVIRHRSTSVTAQAWDLNHPKEKSARSVVSIK